ncbi:MAG: hypothetical protein ACKOFB_02240 [bacterium]
MKHISLISSIILLLLSSCAPEENVVTPNQDVWTLFTIPINENAIYSEKVSGSTLSDRKKIFESTSTIRKVYVYRDQIYVLNPELYSITILNRSNYAVVNAIDFSQQQKKPISMAFGNATTAYVIFEKDSIVMLYDILNKKTASIIKVGKNTVDIMTGNGDRQNQLFVANMESNTISHIDTRTNRVEKEYAVLTAPKFLSNDPTGAKLVFVSEGAGKSSIGGDRGTSGIGFIDIDKKIMLAQMTISTRDADSAEAIPAGLVVSANEWAFIPFSNGLVRVDTREYKTYTTISRNIYSGIMYNERRKEILALKGNEVHVLNDNSGLVQRVLQYNQPLQFIFPQ